MARIRLKAFPATYTPIPFRDLAYMAEKKQEFKNKAFDLETSLDAELGKIGALPVDTSERNRLIGEYKTNLASVYDQNKDNPTGLITGLRQVQRNLSSDLNYGKLGGIHKRYQGYVESAKEKGDYTTSYIKTGKGLTEEEAQQTLNYELSVLNANPIEQTATGNWQTYNTKSVVPHMELQEKANELAKQIKPEEVERYSGLKYVGNGYLVDEKTGDTRLEAEVVQEIVGRTLRTMPEINSYLDFKHTVSGNKNAWANYAMQNPYELLSRDGTQSMEPNAWFTQQYYNDVDNAAANAGNIYAQYKQTKDRDYMQHWLMKEDGKDDKKSQVTPLNIPSTQIDPASVNSTIDNLKTTVIPGTKPTPVFGGSYGPGMGMFETKVVKPDYPKVYNDLPLLDKSRIDFIKTKVNLPADVSTWKQPEWEKAIEALKPYTTKKTSSQMYFEGNNTLRKSVGGDYNAAMENYVYYDPNGNIGVNKNNMYSGSELRNMGVVVDEYVGTMSNSNVIPTQVAGVSYTFAKPDVITVKKADGSKGTQLYVGVNRAQIDNNYILSAFENALTLPTNMGGIPYPLFNNPNMVVIPKGQMNYDIKLPEGQTITIKGDTPEKFREAVINLYNSSPTLQQLIETSIFGNEQ